jgi:hypothetical protein
MMLNFAVMTAQKLKESKQGQKLCTQGLSKSELQNIPLNFYNSEN